jgi:NAD-dependent SIR2 family protein deacetylase
MEGAGVSQAAGIQTFRGTEGLFSQRSKRGSVLELFQKDTFEVRQLSPTVIHILRAGKNPRKAAAHAQQMASIAEAASKAQPTAFHKLLGALQSVGILGRVYTQNIDDLEIKTGLTTGGNYPNCVQLHGSAMEVICTQCSFTEHVYHHFFALKSGELPSCPQCNSRIEERRVQGKRSLGYSGLLRPAIILYGESHPKGEDIAEIQDLDEKKADGLLVVGTSLKTFGSVDLIKKLSANIWKNQRGQVYYMDLQNPPANLFGVFHHIFQTDCQKFAEYMLKELDKTCSISLTSFSGKDNLKDWVNAGTIRNDLRPSWAWV